MSRFTATFVFWSIGGLAGFATLGCYQQKPQELNPPPADSPSISGKAAGVPTQPLAGAPAPLAPTTAESPATKPLSGTYSGETHIDSGSLSTTQPRLPRAEVEIPIDGPARGPKPGVTPLPTTVPASGPDTAPAGAPATNPADPGPLQSAPGVRGFTGTLHGGVVAAGSETTGWALRVDGATGALDVDVTAISGQVKALDGRHVTITGQLKDKNWPALSLPNGVERGKTQLLIAETIAVAPLPDMNK